MGQKVSPVSMRLGVNRDFQANWYADKKDFAKFLNEDIKIRKYLETQLKEAALSKVEIQRGKNEVKLSLHVARPGVVLGQEGATEIFNLTSFFPLKISTLERAASLS